MRRIFRWIAQNSSGVIALCSLFVAACSLGLTFRVASVDIDYKEASIRPIVSVNADVSDFSYYYENHGSGPAVVKRVVFQLDGKCVASELLPVRLTPA
jgi:hypothetical protein